MPTSMTLPTLLPPPVTVSITSLPSPWRHSHWLGWRLRTCPKRLILRHLYSRNTNLCNSGFIKALYCLLVKNLRDARGQDSNRPSPARKAILWFTAKIMSKPGGTIDTWLPEGKKVTFTPVMGSGKKFAAKVGAQGRVSFELNDKNSFALYQYEVKP